MHTNSEIFSAAATAGQHLSTTLKDVQVCSLDQLSGRLWWPRRCLSCVLPQRQSDEAFRGGRMRCSSRIVRGRSGLHE
jgi:hypothetical protein